MQQRRLERRLVDSRTVSLTFKVLFVNHSLNCFFNYIRTKVHQMAGYYPATHEYFLKLRLQFRL